MPNQLSQELVKKSKYFCLGNPFNFWRGDLTGGLTAAIVALPLALAFAVASGVEPQAGIIPPSLLAFSLLFLVVFLCRSQDRLEQWQ